ncbi:MAG: hypothetical protein SCK28_11765 [Bacillota bacterium]|nr:hypothetical protein [Bacillota bacterium]
MTNYNNKVLWALIGLIVAISLTNLSYTKNLQRQIGNLQSELSHIRSQVNHEYANISSLVRSIHEEERWWTPATYQVLEANIDQSVVKMSWQIKEYEENSIVLFNYRLNQNESYQQVEATEEAPGFFSVTIPLEITGEPSINVQVIQRQQESAGTITEEAVPYGYNSGADINLEYYITAENQGIKRSSEKINIYMHELTYWLFAQLNGFIDLSASNNSYRGHLYEFAEMDTYYKAQEIILEARGGASEAPQRWTFEAIGEPVRSMKERQYELNVITKEKYDSFYLIVKYNDGKVFEKKLR